MRVRIIVLFPNIWKALFEFLDQLAQILNLLLLLRDQHVQLLGVVPGLLLLELFLALLRLGMLCTQLLILALERLERAVYLLLLRLDVAQLLLDVV
jgi:hypothetical protein